MSGITEFLARRLRDLTPDKWDAFVRWIDGRFAVLEEQLGIERRVTETILQRGLQVIEDGIGPSIILAQEKAAEITGIADAMSDLADLGAIFTASSTSTLTIGTGAKTVTISAGDRAAYAPPAFVMVYAGATFANAMVGRVVSYDRATGALAVNVTSIFGSGSHSSWTVSPMATTEDLETLRANVDADRVAAEAALASTIEARDATLVIGERYHGASDEPPPGASLGHQYLDTNTTPNSVKVLTETGWAPTVTVSIGGIRTVDYPAASGGETGPFTVGGGFSSGDVFKNGVKLTPGGVEVTLNPGAGTFTLVSALSAGDRLAFRGYLANDTVDIYTKSEVNSLFAGFNGATILARLLTVDTDGSGLNADTVDGIQGASLARKDASAEISSGIFYRWGHALQTDANDGKIGAGLFASGLNILGVQTAANEGRRVRLFGDVIISDDLGVGGVVPGGAFANGKAIALGDNDTGVRQNGDGVLEVWTNNVRAIHINASRVTFDADPVADYYLFQMQNPGRGWLGSDSVNMFYLNRHTITDAYAETAFRIPWSGAAILARDLVAREIFLNKGDGTGAFFFTLTGDRYIGYNGIEYQMAGANLRVGGAVLQTDGNIYMPWADALLSSVLAEKASNAALADGLAQKVSTGALGQQIAGLGVGAIGSFALLRTTSVPGTASPGTTAAGSTLVYTDTDGNGNGGSPSGTWVACGSISITSNPKVTLWQRIS